MKGKKIPERMCTGCQETRPKKDMIRIVRSPEGEFFVDLTGKKSGRGAYICRKKECFDAAKKNHGFERSFKSNIDNHIYDILEQQMASMEELQ